MILHLSEGKITVFCRWNPLGRGARDRHEPQRHVAAAGGGERQPRLPHARGHELRGGRRAARQLPDGVLDALPHGQPHAGQERAGSHGGG